MSGKCSIEDIFNMYSLDYYMSKLSFKNHLLGFLFFKILNIKVFPVVFFIVSFFSILTQDFYSLLLFFYFIFLVFFVSSFFNVLFTAPIYITSCFYPHDLRKEIGMVSKSDVLEYYNNLDKSRSTSYNDVDVFLNDKFLHEIFSIAFGDELLKESSYDGILNNYVTLDNF